MKKQQGFTLVELIVVIILAGFVAGLFLVQSADVKERNDDAARTRDINAIYYYLEGVTFANKHSYPVKLEASALKGLDPESLVDPQGKKINEKDSNYTYQPTGCQSNACTGYKLTAELKQGAPFSRTNPAH